MVSFASISDAGELSCKIHQFVRVTTPGEILRAFDSSSPQAKVSIKSKLLLCLANTGVNAPETMLPNFEFMGGCQAGAPGAARNP